MTSQATTSKVYLAIRVPAGPARAFEAFTREIATWWRPSGLFRITRRGDGRLAFEPGAGGRLYTTFDDGAEFEIGRISVWEPGRRLVFAWRQANFAPEQSTEVEVRFEAVGDETRVSIEHRAWDTLPQTHAARHGFPERATLARAADWWRASLAAFRDTLA
ncbi:MAG TPA: SRPBCC domain-containing protein [Rhodanobacteraceae bacterium]|nr:SRPBCC domain-containing protein [Rhodanobacteraceae bacterium]